MIAPANPLRDLAGDSAYVRSVIDTIPGPVILVGRPHPIPGAGPGLDGYIDPAKFHDVFAQDLPARRPGSWRQSNGRAVLGALSGTSGVPAWKTVPSWYVVTTADRGIPAATQRFMAERRGSEAEGPHTPS
ncbi:hypothetical protein [Streptomyces sp. NPDC002779]|uniref:hypothetical protein n=1 Tax=Streptomyces sp. NPDC002779 TaxID=3364664 RepID=UPI0036C86681